MFGHMHLKYVHTIMIYLYLCILLYVYHLFAVSSVNILYLFIRFTITYHSYVGAKVTIMGQNGAGKSSIIKLLNGALAVSTMFNNDNNNTANCALFDN